MESPWEQWIRPKSMTQPWWKMASAWNEKYESLRAAHWWICMFLTGPKPRDRTWCSAQCWTGWRHRSRQIWGYFWQNTPPVKKEKWSYRIHRILQFIRGPYTYAQCPKAKLKICSLWSQRHTMLPLRMGATKMQVIKGMTICDPCCEGTSGGEEWPTRCRIHEVLHVLLAAWRQFVQSAPTPDCIHCSNWSLAHKILLVLRWPWSKIDCLRLQMSWYSRTISQTHYDMIPLPIRLQRPSPSFVHGLHLNLWSSSQAPKWSWCKLHEQHYWWEVQTPWCEEVVNYTLSVPHEWVGGEVPSNHHEDDWEAGRKWKSWLAKPSGGNSAHL